MDGREKRRGGEFAGGGSEDGKPGGGTGLTSAQAGALPPAVLAYIGDAVFDLFVREMLVTSGAGATARSLHRRATSLVCAPAQARLARALEDRLTQEEKDILRRGRNTHCGHVPPGVEAAAYRLATGLESLVGYLHLTGQPDRIETLLAAALRTQVKGDGG